MEGINLLPNKSKIEFIRIQRAKVVRVIAFWTALVFVVVSGVVLTLNFFLSHQIKKHQKRIGALKVQLSDLSPQIANQQWIRVKVKAVADILQSRRSFSSDVEKTLSIFADDPVTIERIAVGGDSVELRGFLLTSTALKNLEDRLEDEDFLSTLGFESVLLNQAGRRGDGKWSFSIKVNFKK
jgi:Tfp pilus assembly protein PilN